MSAPESQDKKVPHFSSLKFTPAAQPAESCCADHACSSETAAENDALSHARFSWLVEGMDCAACARKVETAVRQVPGVSQVQVLFATEKLLVNAEGNVRPQIESACAPRAISCVMKTRHGQRSPPRGCARICRSSPSSP
jgi:Cd2+/Zn2+-exporting ATPase